LLFVFYDKMRGLEGELERRTLTYTSWNQSAMREKRRSWHPITFDYADANPHKIKEIKVNSRAKFGPIFTHFLSLSHNALEEKCSIQKV
jgi:hypothetical protein